MEGAPNHVHIKCRKKTSNGVGWCLVMYTRQHNSVSSTIILKDILLIVTCYFYVALLLIFYIEF